MFKIIITVVLAHLHINLKATSSFILILIQKSHLTRQFKGGGIQKYMHNEPRSRRLEDKWRLCNSIIYRNQFWHNHSTFRALSDVLCCREFWNVRLSSILKSSEHFGYKYWCSYLLAFVAEPSDRSRNPLTLVTVTDKLLICMIVIGIRWISSALIIDSPDCRVRSLMHTD